MVSHEQQDTGKRIAALCHGRALEIKGVFSLMELRNCFSCILLLVGEYFPLNCCSCWRGEQKKMEISKYLYSKWPWPMVHGDLISYFSVEVAIWGFKAKIWVQPTQQSVNKAARHHRLISFLSKLPAQKYSRSTWLVYTLCTAKCKNILIPGNLGFDRERCFSMFDERNLQHMELFAS